MAWRFSGVALDTGLATLSDLATSGNYSIVALPHNNLAEAEERKPLLPPSPCHLLATPEDNPNKPRRVGWMNARVLSPEQFQARVRAVVREPNRHGWFFDIWFASSQWAQRCRHARREQ